MARPAGFVDNINKRRAGEPRARDYRAVTLGGERSDWAVVDRDGAVVFRGDARVAALIASRLTRPDR